MPFDIPSLPLKIGQQISNLNEDQYQVTDNSFLKNNQAILDHNQMYLNDPYY